MNKQGFTLIEVLITVVIIGILTSVALPQYMRSVERARATEAMNAIKALNDSIYVYYSEKEQCPTKFSQLAVVITPDPSAPHPSLASDKVDTKFFLFRLKPLNVPYVPGTECRGVMAARRNGGNYKYGIYNPYELVAGKASSLACSITSEATTEDEKRKSRDLCESLGWYRVPTEIP